MYVLTCRSHSHTHTHACVRHLLFQSRWFAKHRKHKKEKKSLNQPDLLGCNQSRGLWELYRAFWLGSTPFHLTHHASLSLRSVHIVNISTIGTKSTFWLHFLRKKPKKPEPTDNCKCLCGSNWCVCTCIHACFIFLSFSGRV